MQHKWRIKPASVNVGGNKYTTVQSKGLWITNGLIGESNHVSNTISVDSALCDDRKSQVFCHELAHAIDNAFSNNVASEEVINGFAEGLWQVLQQWGIEFDWD